MDTRRLTGPRDRERRIGPHGGAWILAPVVACVGVAAFALSASVPGCASQEETYRVRLENTGKPALHAVHSERLESIMERLDALMFERQRTQVEIARDRRRLTEQAEDVSAELLESATHIAETGETLGLSSSEKDTYLSLVEKLQRQAGALAALAEQGDADALSAQYNRITTTCNACHSNFRDAREAE